MPSNKLLKLLLIISIILSIGITTIIVIIIARGGQINDPTSSGLLRIHVNPENIEYVAFVNDQEYPVTTDKRINNLKEGIYDIRIEAKNYTSWQKEVSVKNDIVTDIYVKLYPLDLKLTQSTKSNIDKAIFSKDGNYVFYTIINAEIGSDKGLWSLQLDDNSSIFGTTQSEAVKILDFDSIFEKALQSSTLQIIPSPDNNKVLLIDRANESAYIIDGKKKNSAPYTNIYPTIGYSSGDILWFSSSQDLIFSEDKLIFDYNINDQTKTVVFYDNENIVKALNSSQILILDHNKLYTYKDKKLTPLELSGAKIPDNIVKMHQTELDDVIIFETKTQDQQGIVYFNIEKLFMKSIPQFNGENFELIEINKTADALLLKSKDDDYYVFNIEEKIALNTFETKLTKLDVVKDDMSIEEISFSSHGGHFIIIYKNKTNQYELKARDKDGTNETNLIQSDGIIKSAEFNSKVSYLYLLIQIKEESNTLTNIFRMNLDK